MKKFTFAILFICTVSLLGCNVNKKTKVTEEESKTTIDEVSSEAEEHKEEEITKNSFKIVKPEFYTENMKAMIENMKDKRGFIEYANENNHYIIIFAGKKNTGGFDISLLEAYDKGEDASIIIKESGPSTNDKVTQAITYPTIVVKVTKAFKNIEVLTDNGEKLSQLEYGEKY